MLKKILIVLFFVIIAAVIFGGLYFWNQISWPVSSSAETESFTVRQGEGVKEIAANLEAVGLIRSQFWFETYVYVDRSETEFIAGTYSLSPDMNIKEIVSAFKQGENTHENTITIIEGWDSEEIAEYLQEKGIVSSDTFLQTAAVADSREIIPDTTYDFLADKPEDQGLEGYLFPDTYRVYEDAEAADIVEKMLDNFGEKFTDDMKKDAAKGNMSVYEIVTLASIIEKEVRTDEDRKIAAGIFYDRLNVGVPLESDATVNYVTGKQALRPSASDLAANSLYNTYKYKGLPPGPICNPSLSAMLAAIYPETTDYFYFLTKPDGSTVFSKTYDEHLENKRKYLD